MTNLSFRRIKEGTFCAMCIAIRTSIFDSMLILHNIRVSFFIITPIFSTH